MAFARGHTVANHTALFFGASWVDAFDVLTVRAQPAFVTFSFPTLAPEHVRDEFGGAAATWARFTEAEKDLAREALRQWADASGLTFLEVEGDKGDIQFNWIDFNHVAGKQGALGFAYYPNGTPIGRSTTVERFSALSGDVFLNAADRSTGLASADRKLFVLLHEIGHAVGLKHPFAPSDANRNVLVDKLDNQVKTVMSYTGDEGPRLGPLDRAAIQALYGHPSADGSHLSSWTWSKAAERLTQIGTSAPDRLYGVSVSDRIEGGAGSDTISGLAGDDVLVGGTGIDTLIGGDGDDILRPGPGRGVVHGGEGTDILDLSDLTVPVSVRDHVSDMIWFGAQRGAADVNVSGIEVFIGTDRDDVFAADDESESSFIGGDGDDRFVMQYGEHVLDGGRGFDLVDYSNRSGFSNNFGAVRIDLALTTPQASGDTLIGIEAVIGSDWDDRLIAGKGPAVLDGFFGSDRLIGGRGDDRLDGSADRDRIEGGGGDDIIIGGPDTDTLTGGTGADVFVLETSVGVDGYQDLILDFEAGRDRVQLLQSRYLDLPTGRLSADLFCIGSAPADANDRIVYDPQTGALSLVLDRIGAPKLHLAQFERGVNLTAADFSIV